MSDILITGTKINYFFVCYRKLWLFSHNISMEQNSGLVEMGKVIHETSYERKRKEIDFDGIKIDFFDKNRGVIHEVKKSKAVEDAHIWQLKYYIYYFDKLGIEVSGMINYPIIRRTEKVILTDSDKTFIEEVIDKIQKIVNTQNPPTSNKKAICKNCSYFELCFV